MQPCDEDKVFSFFFVMEPRWNEIDRGKPKNSGGKACPSSTLSTTNLTWTDLGLNPGLRGEMPATNRLSHGTAIPRRYVIMEREKRNKTVHHTNLAEAFLTCRPTNLTTQITSSSLNFLCAPVSFSVFVKKLCSVNCMLFENTSSQEIYIA
jgi:hypothetical protein